MRDDSSSPAKRTYTCTVCGGSGHNKRRHKVKDLETRVSDLEESLNAFKSELERERIAHSLTKVSEEVAMRDLCEARATIRRLRAELATLHGNVDRLERRADVRAVSSDGTR